MPELNADEQAIIDKARGMASETSGVGGDKEGPPPSPATPATPSSGNQEEWGPYDDYFLVTPPWGGQFGVEKGKILYFEEKEVFNRRENMMKTVKIPRQRDPVAEAKIVTEHEAAEAEGLAEAKTKIAESKLEKAST